MPEFEIFRSKHNADHYVAVLAGDRSDNAMGVRASQNLKPLTRIDDNRKPHLGFDAAAAKRAILEQRPQSAVRDALLADTALTERQKQVLLDIYDSFCRENESAPPGPAPDIESGTADRNETDPDEQEK